MVDEIRDSANAELRRCLLPHADGVGIVEAKRAGHHQSHFCQRAAKLGFRPQALPGENFLGQRAGIFRIDVDIAPAKRLPQDARAAELAAMTRGGAGRADQPGDDLAQDHGFGEFL